MQIIVNTVPNPLRRIHAELIRLFFQQLFKFIGIKFVFHLLINIIVIGNSCLICLVQIRLV